MFLEDVRFPDTIAQGAEGGPAFLVDLVQLASGYEQRNLVQSAPRRRYTVALLNRRDDEFSPIVAIFRIAQGRTHGFRFRDWHDYQVTTTDGRLGTSALGTGLAAYQIHKRYTSGSNTTDQPIKKPRSGTVTVYRNASPVTVGAGAGQIAIDHATGIVTFVADQSRSITSHLVGASHQFTLATAFSPNLAIGGRIYVTGITGTAATLLNNIAHAVTGVATNVITVSTATTGLTASGGTAFFYPQPTDALTWAGDYDVPVRFDVDRMSASAVKRAGSGLAITWDSIELIELRI